MSLCCETQEIKEGFGKRLRSARDAKGYSRQVLGTRLGVSPKTVQSWENGRTFIEKLSLIPAIERELGVCISQLIEEAIEVRNGNVDSNTTNSIAAEPAMPYGKAAQLQSSIIGPIPVSFSLAESAIQSPCPVDLSDKFVVVPLIKQDSTAKEVSELQKKDTNGYSLISKEWAPRGGVLIAYKTKDSAMSPAIPKDSIVIIDRRKIELSKAIDETVALYIKDKGIRIRKLVKDSSGTITGMPYSQDKRGKVQFSQKDGDSILGRVVCISTNNICHPLEG